MLCLKTLPLNPRLKTLPLNPSLKTLPLNPSLKTLRLNPSLKTLPLNPSLKTLTLFRFETRDTLPLYPHRAQPLKQVAFELKRKPSGVLVTRGFVERSGVWNALHDATELMTLRTSCCVRAPRAAEPSGVLVTRSVIGICVNKSEKLRLNLSGS